MPTVGVSSVARPLPTGTYGPSPWWVRTSRGLWSVSCGDSPGGAQGRQEPEQWVPDKPGQSSPEGCMGGTGARHTVPSNSRPRLSGSLPQWGTRPRQPGEVPCRSQATRAPPSPWPPPPLISPAAGELCPLTPGTISGARGPPEAPASKPRSDTAIQEASATSWGWDRTVTKSRSSRHRAGSPEGRPRVGRLQN